MQWRQPLNEADLTPGARLGVCPTPLARRGCGDRWTNVSGPCLLRRICSAAATTALLVAGCAHHEPSSVARIAMEPDPLKPN